GIELSAAFTATANAELKVGALEETITVTGANSLVDIQNVATQAVLKRELLDATPTAQTLTGFTSLTIGLVATGSSAQSPDVAGGVEVNVVPKSGGNEFRGVFNADWSDGKLQASNIDDDLTNRGLKNQPGLDYLFDISAGYGGPLVRDKVWFYEAFREQSSW